MSDNQRVFGSTADGREVVECAIRGGNITASILTWGAVVRDVRLGGDQGRPVTLGLNSIGDYEAHSPYLGAIVGRSANRINKGQMTFQGKALQLAQNRDGHHAHGGFEGFSRRIWTIAEHDENRLKLELFSPDGDEGYPGNVTATCEYSLSEDGVFSIRLGAVTDAPTLINMANHCYFNLDQADTVLDHEFEVASEAYTVLGDGLIPTGEIRSIADSEFDFRSKRPIRFERDGKHIHYNLNFVIDTARRDTVKRVGCLTGPATDTEMEIWSTEPGLQFFDGINLALPVLGLDGRLYQSFAAVALEPQCFPDAPNHDDFPDTTLLPDQEYLQITEYRFKW
ncbi:aldose epimerase family protein [Ruegeria hyattellae]|uniref:aldose epimerase family protein n=1 Tax=Ruegeria hyattellae TaxID=3233337 RepID=UPI00355C69EB